MAEFGELPSNDVSDQVVDLFEERRWEYWISDLAEIRAVAIWFHVLNHYGIRYSPRKELSEISRGLSCLWTTETVWGSVLRYFNSKVAQYKADVVIGWIEGTQ